MNTKVTAPMIDAGMVVQVVSSQTGAVASGTTVLPYDDTIPQNAEGVQFLTASITPKSLTNKLKIDVTLNVQHSASGIYLIAALFQDATASALAAFAVHSSASEPRLLSFTHYMTAGSVAAINFNVRAGSDQAGTITLNGIGGARKLGGVGASSITITEIQVQ